MEKARLLLRVHSIGWETDAVRAIELRDPTGDELPAFEPGAHIDLLLPGKIKRSYSLVGLAEDRQRYEIAVHREPQSRGGSQWLHDKLRVGDLIAVDAPLNNFPLATDGDHAVFVAGGIGITPILPMVDRLARSEHSFELYYSARSLAAAAFLDRLARFGDRLRVALTREPNGCRFDIREIAARAPARAHLYCCGPTAMINDFQIATSDRDPSFLHIERFTSPIAVAADGGYVVELARTGRAVHVPMGKTILQALLDEGLDVPCSCLEGVCGTCETRIIEGVADHRDLVLSDEERASNKTMMICCSGAKSQTLVLDL